MYSLKKLFEGEVHFPSMVGNDNPMDIGLPTIHFPSDHLSPQARGPLWPTADDAARGLQGSDENPQVF